MFRAKALRDEALEPRADSLLFLTSEHALRGRIEYKDVLLLVDDDDGVDGRLDDSLEPLRAFDDRERPLFGHGKSHGWA